MGMTLGLVWTPCAGPILASILTVVATSPAFQRGALLLLTYSVGAALPMLAIAYGGQIVTTRIGSLARVSHRLQQGFGLIIIAFAVEEIVAAVAEELIAATGRLSSVGSKIAVEIIDGVVIARAADAVAVNLIVIRAAQQQIRADVAGNQVVARAAIDGVVACAGRDSIVACVAINSIAADAADQIIRAFIRAAHNGHLND